MPPTTTAPIAIMDLSKVRKTEDGKVSVIDVISQIKKCSAHYAAQVYQRLLSEERVPQCEVRNIAQRTSESTVAGSARTTCRPNYLTPIASADLEVGTWNLELGSWKLILPILDIADVRFAAMNPL